MRLSYDLSSSRYIWPDEDEAYEDGEEQDSLVRLLVIYRDFILLPCSHAEGMVTTYPTPHSSPPLSPPSPPLYPFQLLHKSALEGTKNAPVDYRRVAMFFKEAVYKRDGGKGKPRDTDDSNGSSSSGGEDALPRTGRIDWGKLLAAVSESQRTTMLTMSGINLTSVDAREAYAKVCEAERLKAEQKDKDRGGSGSGRTKTGRRGKGSSRRRGRGVGIDRSRDGRRIGSGGAGGGETDSEVAERNLRAFRTIKYV